MIDADNLAKGTDYNDKCTCIIYNYNASAREEDPEIREFLSYLAEGKLEGRLEAARNMLSDGLTPNAISKYTGLSLQEIKHLQ